MFIYNSAPGANITTNGSANTDTDHLRVLTQSARSVLVKALRLMGKGAGLTSLSGIQLYLRRYTTASTAGSGLTPRPSAPSAPAADLTAFTGPTVGATVTLVKAVGCGAAGPGAWVAEDDKSAIQLETGGGAKGNLDLVSQSGSTGLNLEYDLVHEE